VFNSKWISAIKYVQYQTSRKKKLSLDARLGFCFNTKTGLNLYEKNDKTPSNLMYLCRNEDGVKMQNLDRMFSFMQKRLKVFKNYFFYKRICDSDKVNLIIE
jgi:hypothetical protein